MIGHLEPNEHVDVLVTRGTLIRGKKSSQQEFLYEVIRRSAISYAGLTRERVAEFRG